MAPLASAFLQLQSRGEALDADPSFGRLEARPRTRTRWPRRRVRV
jgi:hypothetical protein